MANDAASQLFQQTAAVFQTANDHKTLTAADRRHQVFTGLLVTKDCTLPSTGIVAGDTFRIENTTAFDLVIKASDGSALTVANGANIDATIRSGFVLLRSSQATPTTPAHWKVLDVQDEGTYSENFSNIISTACTVRWIRRNRAVQLGMTCPTATASGSGYLTLVGTNSPVRTRPSHSHYSAMPGTNNGLAAVFNVTIQQTGQILIMPPGGGSVWTGTVGVGGGGANEYAYFQYQSNGT